MHRERPLIAVIVLACLFVIGFTADGYSQQKSDGLQDSEAQHPSTVQESRGTWPRREALSIEVIADLSVNPLTYSGPCPAIFTFKGRITVNKKTAVRYRFSRSDGVRTEVKTLTFAKPGRLEVTYIWQLGEAVTLPTFSGVVIMEIIYPINKKIQSNEASFRGSCTAQGQSDMMISSGPRIAQQGPYMLQPLPGPQTGPRESPRPMSPPMPAKDQQGTPIPQPGAAGSMPQSLPLPQKDQQESSRPQMAPQGHSTESGQICLPFNPATTNVQQIQGGWKVVDGANILFGFGVDKIEAENALTIIKHYRMNQSCFVGGPKPSFHFMLAGGSPPSGPFPGEDCRPFNPVTTEIRQMQGNWKIVDGNQTLFDFGPNKADADQSLAIIRKYGFTHSCMMARGSLDFLYLRK